MMKPKPQIPKNWRKIPKEPIVLSDEINLQVLYEDNHLIAVNKRNSDIIQSDKSGDAPLSEIIKRYLKIKYDKPGNVYLGTIHRIDRPVSGVVLYAKTSKALTRMTNAFKYREVQKTYWAVVRNPLPKKEDFVINYLRKNEKRNKSYAFHEMVENAKQSELQYKMIGRGTNYSFVEIYPKTGRHHQIRVTLSDLGSPIKGDIKYGDKRTNKNASIHLHARQIDFIHPVKKTPTRIIAPPPEDALWNEFLRIENGLR